MASETEIAAAFNAFAGRGFFVEPTSATAGAVFDEIFARAEFEVRDNGSRADRTRSQGNGENHQTGRVIDKS